MYTKNSDRTEAKEPKTVIEQILDAARWAPSGDNTQPWRFEIVDDHHIVVHGHDTRDWCVYDLEGRASQLAIGALLESVAIAASQFGLRTDFRLRPDSPETKPVIDVFLHPDETVTPDPLHPYLPLRSVNRRPFHTRPLTPREKQALESSVGGQYRILWLEGWKKRLQTAKLMFHNAKLRLTMPEAYEVHKKIIDWNKMFSEDKVPDRAIGLDPLTLKLMHWAMQSWQRVTFLNRWLAATWLPRVELDLLPGLFCAAHFAIIADAEPQTLEDYLSAGRVLQRFWLTATSLGLQMQPELTPVIFSGYVRSGNEFTNTPSVQYGAKHLTCHFRNLFNESEKIVFVGRIGQGTNVRARSMRKSLSSLASTQH